MQLAVAREDLAPAEVQRRDVELVTRPPASATISALAATSNGRSPIPRTRQPARPSAEPRAAPAFRDEEFALEGVVHHRELEPFALLVSNRHAELRKAMRDLCSLRRDVGKGFVRIADGRYSTGDGAISTQTVSSSEPLAKRSPAICGGPDGSSAGGCAVQARRAF
jgi:hypothetical protein